MPPDNILTPTDITAELQEHRTFEQLLTERLQRWTHRARDEQRRQLDQRIRTSQPRMRPARLRPGDLVIFETGRYKPGPTKLQRQFSPDLHVVLRQVNANLVEIRDTRTAATSRVHVSKLSLFVPRRPFVEMNDAVKTEEQMPNALPP